MTEILLSLGIRYKWLIVLTLATGCAAPHHPEVIASSVAVKSSPSANRLGINAPEGEQADILQQYGEPDQVNQRDMGIVSWTYCVDSDTPVFITFDRNGAVMNQFVFTSPACLSR